MNENDSQYSAKTCSYQLGNELVRRPSDVVCARAVGLVSLFFFPPRNLTKLDTQSGIALLGAKLLAEKGSAERSSEMNSGIV